jgi:Acetoacetate decarboxylase (ADC)
MSHLQEIEEVPYPPAPWKCSGQMWTGIFKSHVPRPLPGEFKHLLAPHLFVVSLIRYLDGTLRYDELLFSTPARLGARLGTYVTDIWVNDLASLWGGRRIWGLPKNLANFNWDGSIVQITDDHGLIAKISVDMRPARLPLIWMPAPGFGRLGQAWTYYVGSLWAHLGKAGMQIVEWPARFAALQNNKPTFSFGAKPFVEMQVPSPKILSFKE